MKGALKNVARWFVLPLLFFACNASINETVRLRDGETRTGSINTINGSILIGNNCEVDGDCRSVNGRIEVGKNSRVRNLQAVNGHIRIESGSQVDEDISTLNGPVSCYAGVKVDGSIKSVNGGIELHNVTVGGDLETHNSGILLADKCRIKGDVRIKKSHGRGMMKQTIEIKIDGGSVVEGDLYNEDPDLGVRVVLASGGKVLGKVDGAEVINQ